MLASLWQTLLAKVSTWLFIEGVLVWIPYYLVDNQIKGNHVYPQESQINRKSVEQIPTCVGILTNTYKYAPQFILMF